MINFLKFTALVLFLLLFFCVGIAIINPDWFIRRSGVRKGGELLTEWNRLEFKIMGAIIAGFVIYIVYDLLGN